MLRQCEGSQEEVRGEKGTFDDKIYFLHIFYDLSVYVHRARIMEIEPIKHLEGQNIPNIPKLPVRKKEYLQKYIHNMNRVPRLLFANSFDYSNSKKILYKFRLSRIIMNNPNQLIASNPNSQLIDNSIFSNHSRIFKFLMMKQ